MIGQFKPHQRVIFELDKKTNYTPRLLKYNGHECRIVNMLKSLLTDGAEAYDIEFSDGFQLIAFERELCLLVE